MFLFCIFGGRKAGGNKEHKAGCRTLDFSMKELYGFQWKHAGYPHYFRNSQEKLAKAQRKLSHCRKGSNRYKNSRKSGADSYTYRHQKDYLHKESRKITNFWRYRMY